MGAKYRSQRKALMSAPKTVAEGAGTISESDILNVYNRIKSACSAAGLSLADAQDVAQEIWVWALQGSNLALVASTPWMGAVAHNFVLRYWRRRGRSRERTGLEDLISRCAVGHVDDLDRTISLNEIEITLPGLEASLLQLVREGESFMEAARQLGIARGSRAYFRKRLIAHMREGFGRVGDPDSEKRSFGTTSTFRRPAQVDVRRPSVCSLGPGVRVP
jgi:DNA-directed RNA polymerase specialized sigma24 family protein